MPTSRTITNKDKKESTQYLDDAFGKKNSQIMDDAAGPSQQQLTFLPFQPVPRAPTGGFNLGYKVSPGILLVVIVLAILVFLGGLVHLIVRILKRTRVRDPDDGESVTALQGQLQQLLDLHDAGVEQSFIDTLPVFRFKAILGHKAEDLDCAVCLCEFEPEDKLRLLPKCSHGFHMECIDKRHLDAVPLDMSLVSELPDARRRMLSLREIVCNDRDRDRDSVSILVSDIHFEMGSGRSRADSFAGKEKDRVVHVKLGKFLKLDCGENTVDSRRCFSMGSFEYVMNETSTLLVPIGSHRSAGDASHVCENGKQKSGIDKESFSISKIWQRGKEKAMSSRFIGVCLPVPGTQTKAVH